jgi:protoporphyrinogen/coproporphyrinogen III oxidase
VSTSSSLPYAVVGGGITGLAAAHTLARAGHPVRLFEAGQVLGGPLQSELTDGWLVEAGPNSLQESSAELSALLTELGLDAEKVYAQPEAKNRYILRGGQPVAAPASPPALLSSKLFSWRAKLRLFAEFAQRPRRRPADVSLATFVRDHFGRELVDYGLNPFVAGIYAGDPEQLSAQHAFPSLWAIEREHGSILRGQIKAAKARRAAGGRAGPPPIITFAQGLARLPASLAAALPADTIERNARVTALRPGAPWRLTWVRDGMAREETFAGVILTTPAAGLAQLVIGAAEERPLAELAEIIYPPVASLFLGYRREQVAHPLDGFGMLVPAVERSRLLGVLFSSSLFPGRAPAGHVALTVMVGGLRDPALGEAALAKLLPLVREELARLLGVSGEPVFVRHNAWPRAIPQYNLGYERFLNRMRAVETAHPGLLIGGHVRDGIAVPACLAAGQKLARRVLGEA